MNLYKIKKTFYAVRYVGLYYAILKIMNKENRKILYRYLEAIREEEYPKAVEMLYKIQTGKRMDILQPKSFNEKMQWMKIYDTSELKTELTDKIKVREWVKKKAGEKYLIPMLGRWKCFEDIPLEKLPAKFVLKTNHGSGYVLIIKEKEKLDYNCIKNKVNEWMKENFAFMGGLELQYKEIIPEILIEEYIEGIEDCLYDFKIHCFQGKPECIQVIGDRDTNKHTAKEIFLDTNWNKLECTYTYPRYGKEFTMERPQKLEEMLWLAENLSKNFRYVRVDLYVPKDGNIKFGEMTFTPASGYDRWRPAKYDRIWGDKIRL